MIPILLMFVVLEDARRGKPLRAASEDKRKRVLVCIELIESPIKSRSL
jgi:hypothetical protein